MAKTIERKFEKRIHGVPQFVSDYSDFQDLPIGSLAMILTGGKGNEFIAYFEKSIIDQDLSCQKVFLQYSKEQVIKEYLLPFKGRISLKDFQNNIHRTYQIE